MDSAAEVPRPGEWHPWYSQQPENRVLLDWLQSDDLRPFALPIERRPRFIGADEPVALAGPVQPVLHKRLAYFGPQNYRDRLVNPGVNWYVATDQYGRSVCSEPFTASL